MELASLIFSPPALSFSMPNFSVNESLAFKMSATSKRREYMGIQIHVDLPISNLLILCLKIPSLPAQEFKKKVIGFEKMRVIFSWPVCRTSRLIVQLGEQFAGETKNPTAKEAEVALAASPSVLVPSELAIPGASPSRAPGSSQVLKPRCSFRRDACMGPSKLATGMMMMPITNQ